MKKILKNTKGLLSNFKISNNDIDSLTSYIKDRQTAILVIMFTDIVGFTKISEKYGENYAATLRQNHDKILTSAIENNNYGKVIKYIGDSVMAVFSEPTKAVEISMLIHNKLDEFNQNMPDMEDIQIRVGLHMGQVAIENHIQSDIFGRHVNRASRIESLAGPGQTYLSFPVFDSAKGWLQDLEYLGWKSHGEYFLKGIDKPAEIFEVFNKLKKTSKPPSKGKKKRIIPSYIFIILFLVLGGLTSWGIFNYQKKEVFLFDFNYEDTRLLNGEKLFIDGEPGDHKRLLLNKMTNGKQILYYDVSSSVRYYSEIEIDRGVNLINPEFKYSSLPRFEIETYPEDGNIINKRFEKNIVYYNLEGIKHEDTAHVELTIEKIYTGNIVDYKIKWNISLNNKTVEDGSDNISWNITNNDYNIEDWKVISDHSVFDFEYRPITSRGKLQINISGAWK